MRLLGSIAIMGKLQKPGVVGAADGFGEGLAIGASDPPDWASHGTGTTASSATSLTIPLTTLREDGDLLIAHCQVGAAGKTFSISGTGWTIGDTSADGSACWAWRIVDGTETTPTISWSGAAPCVAQMIEWFNTSGGNPIGNKGKASGSGTTVSLSGITITDIKSTVFSIVCAQNSQSIPTQGGYTNIQTFNTGGNGSFLYQYQFSGSVGSSSGSISTTITSAAWETFLIEIKNASAPSSFGNASGIGSSSVVGFAGGTSGSVASASGVGDAIATSRTIRGATAASSGMGATSAVGSTGPASAVGSAAGIGAAVGASPGPASDFLARTSGLNSTHAIAYMDLINGLVTDGVWSKLDVLYIFATADLTTALLNLVSTSFTGITHGPPTFTADRGFTGVDGSSTVYIDSQFNPATASSPQFVTNSCHASAWCDTSVTAGGGNAGAFLGSSGASGNQTSLYGRYNDGKAYFRINDGVTSAGLTSASSVGHWIASRTSSSVSVGYKNGASFVTPNQASGTIQSRNIYILAFNNNGSVLGGTGGQLTMVSFGAGLTATDASNFYSRLRTYMTAMGVP